MALISRCQCIISWPNSKFADIVISYSSTFIRTSGHILKSTSQVNIRLLSDTSNQVFLYVCITPPPSQISTCCVILAPQPINTYAIQSIHHRSKDLDLLGPGTVPWPFHGFSNDAGLKCMGFMDSVGNCKCVCMQKALGVEANSQAGRCVQKALYIHILCKSTHFNF